MALLDTHYYGGIKKYQWASIPLALHGVVAVSYTHLDVYKRQGLHHSTPHFRRKNSFR